MAKGKEQVDVHELAGLAEDVARRAGALLLAGRDRYREVVATKSSPTDLVTATDHASERLIVDAISSARPNDAVLGEEGTARPGTTGVRWVIDPLDGTVNFRYGLAFVNVSIGMEVAGVTEVGVVFDPIHDECFRAIRDDGATLNGQPIACSAVTELGLAMLGTGFSYAAATRAAQASALATVVPAVRDIRRFGAAALDLCWTACGRLDAFFERGLAPWDHTAGTLIATEAGARTGDLEGGPVSTIAALVAPPALFKPLRQLLIDAGA